MMKTMKLSSMAMMSQSPVMWLKMLS
jgi:hypothetical protein